MKKSSTNNPIATICIPATDWDESLLRCLDSLNNQSIKQFKIVIILRNKLKILKKNLHKYSFPISIIVQKKHGLVSAMNLGLENTKSDLFIRIDDDVVCDAEWFNNIRKPFENPHVGGVTGPTIVPETHLNNRPILKFIKQIISNKNIFLMPFKKLYMDFLYEGKIFNVSTFVESGNFTFGSNFESSIPNSEKIVDNLEACNFAVRTKILKKLGGFDPIFSEGLGEYHEADIAMKVRKAGYVLIFHPGAFVKHLVQPIKLRGDAYGRLLNFMIFYRRYFHIKNPKIFAKFLLNVTIQSCYHIMTFIKT